MEILENITTFAIAIIILLVAYGISVYLDRRYGLPRKRDPQPPQVKGKPTAIATKTTKVLPKKESSGGEVSKPKKQPQKRKKSTKSKEPKK